MRRIVQPEKLDSLAENDLGAVANRKDIRRLNRFMCNFSWMRKALVRAQYQSDHAKIAEWAAGDGELGHYLHRHRAVARVTGIDRWSRPRHWPQEWAWHQGSLEDWSDYAAHPVVIGNLILHQFDDTALTDFGRRLDRHAQVLIFNEPFRSKAAVFFARQLKYFGAHPVTQHDAVVSVQAGFRDDELPACLGLPTTRWHWTIATTALGAYRMIAQKKEPPR